MPVWQREIQTGSTPITLVGTGGTSTILARMEAQLDTLDRAAIESTRLSFDRLQLHTKKLWDMPLAQREAVVGLPRKRADVVLTGTVIYEAIMEMFQLPELRISTRGLRFAAVMDER
jgi:exopolyphosphatase/guanosine-5'-triphosphate,3'-diphosphate pyrophosphatase